MTCCILGLLLMAAVGRIRRLFGGRPKDAALFAPVARRPAPGEELPVAEAVTTEPAPPVRGRTEVFVYCALAIAVFGVGAPALVAAGVLHNTGSAVPWVLRSVLYGAAAAAALALSRSTAIWRAPQGVGTLLVILGAVIFELSVLDMHVFRLFSIDNANVLGMLVFHNIGPAVAMVGGAVLGYGSLGRSRTSWRSSRSTVTSARPSSPAVTVSSTAPLTR